MIFKRLKNNNKYYYSIERENYLTKPADSIYVTISNANYYEYFSDIDLSHFQLIEDIEFESIEELIGILEDNEIIYETH